MPSITTDGVVILVLICAALTLQMTRWRRNGQTIFNGGILLVLGLSIACALPLLSRLPWEEFVHEALDQIVAAIQFLEVTYVILTL